MTTEDKELKELTDKILDIANALLEEEIKLERLIDRKSTDNGNPTKTNDLDWAFLNSTRRMVLSAAAQLHDIRVDLEARMD